MFLGLVGALVGGLVVDLEGRVGGNAFFGWAVGPPFGLLVGLVVGLAVGPILLALPERTVAVEEFHFVWREAESGFWMVTGLAVALVTVLIIRLEGGSAAGSVGGMIGGLFVGVVGALFVGLQPRPVERRSGPNRGTLRSLRYAVRVALPGVVAAVASAITLERLFLGHAPRGLAGLPVVIIAYTLVLAFDKGGTFALRHYIIRLFLWRLGDAPLRYVQFLNEATERLFLIRHGGSYECFHLTFRDYMADAFESGRFSRHTHLPNVAPSKL